MRKHGIHRALEQGTFGRVLGRLDELKPPGMLLGMVLQAPVSHAVAFAVQDEVEGWGE